MPITFRCPDGHKLTVADSLAGRKARCPACRRKMYVPRDSSDPHQVARPVLEESSHEFQEFDASNTTLVVAVPAENLAEGPLATADLALHDAVLEALDAPLAPSKTTPLIYQPHADKVQTVRLLTLALAAAAVFSAGPVGWYPNPLTAPDWVRLVLLVAIAQLAYVAWLATLPDWVGVWVAMLVSALVATLYGAALAIFLYTPVDSPLALGLNDVSRRTAAGWCLCVVLISSMMSFVSGRVCAAWRRADEFRQRRALSWREQR